MELKILGGNFTVCKVEDTKNVDFSKDFTFISKTDEEISLVCKTDHVPQNTVERSDGWRGFRIESRLDFSLIGILSKISTILAKNNVGIFAISTFNTDYILVKEKDFETAVTVLKENGYRILE
ncbi:MAG: ACT domain-containing protein [Butyrivibrio sp.]|uniref:ACT domain-containing protein n=1 Tax=Butyrivibrio sp. NC2002 TaxID=1410610 RepID=UPI00055CDD10|nr:ACT domain-containing protein [Butyrivibrio sp. NC2002]MBE5859877.1 ACT domain-containing protein [Butyrivibrio sp.]